MTRRLRLGFLLATLVAAACLGAASREATAQAPAVQAPAVQPPIPQAPAAVAPPAVAPPAVAPVAARIPRQTLRYESGTGGIVNLPAPAANVFVADPKIAEVRPASATTLFVFGVGAGRTTVAAVDAAGVSIAEYDVFVRPPVYAATEAQATIARVLPSATIRVSPQTKGLMVTGTVGSPEEAARAVAIARGFLAEGQVVDDQISVTGGTQVMLRVRIAEIQRSVTRNLGIDWQALGVIGSIARLPALAFNANAASTGVLGGAPTAGAFGNQGVSFNGLIDALAQDNLARVLAEPNLTVLSGHSASFLAGGEYPIPVGQNNGMISIEFKKFGVNLTFLPTVLTDGRINMKVAPEVSQLSDDNAVQLVAGGLSFRVPGLTVRRAETVVELGSGQSFAIAGLLQDSLRQADKALPGIGEVPILGALFRSDRFQRNETELVILITPFVVKPVNDPNQLRMAGDNYTVPNDRDRLLMMRQTGGPPAPPSTLPGAAPAPALVPMPLSPPGRPGRPGFILQ
jgi:pilus assembly protein CpaC